MAFLPKYMIENILRRLDDLERRTKRLELMEFEEAKRMEDESKSKIASLRDEEAGKGYKDGFLTIEKILDKRGSI